MKQFTLHMVGNAHLDPVWLWTWQEGFQEAKATFRSALDRLSESDDFLFTSSSAAVYEWIERNAPAMFAEIQARVAEGRWHLAGGWWIQPDCNLPGGESFVRQALYGQRYFQSRFGVTATVGYNVDSFGHHAMLPQILVKSGMDSYVFTRPEPHEKGLPGRLFWWESDDGSRVLAFRIPFEYVSWAYDLEKYVRRCMGELKPPTSELMCFYGVGNHGGGPTRENIESIRRLNADPAFPTLVFSTPARFFADMRASRRCFPVVHDELQHHASGCYALHSGVKRWNRQGEQALLAAEKFAALAERMTGLPYPEDFARAWKNLLFNQFHDILAGTSIEAAYEDARDAHGETMAIAGRALNDAIQSLSWNINIPAEAGMRPIVVFNPHAWPSRTPVEMDFGRLSGTDALLDDQGCQIAFQATQPATIISGWRTRIAFVADLPPLGYRVYRMLPQPANDAQASLQPDAQTEDADTLLENEHFRLEFDAQSGFIARLYDKRAQVDVFLGDAARPVVLADASDTWGHGVYHFQDAIGAFSATRVQSVERGPVRSIVRVESAYGDSRLTQDFIMYRELDQIDVRVTLDWREQHKALKLRFPLNLNFINATYEIPYGHIVRPTNGEEEPGQTWVDLTGIARGVEVPYGLSLLNDSKYSFDVKGRELSLTVLRSPIYAHHDPTRPQPGARYSYIDQGVQRFCYTLLPHADGWEHARTVQRAAELNQRLVTLVESYHSGPLPQRDSYLSVDQPNVIVSVVKRAEDGDDLLIRCYEAHKIETRACICLPRWNRRIEAHFGPCEIKTFRVPRDSSQPVVETNLLEEG